MRIGCRITLHCLSVQARRKRLTSIAKSTQRRCTAVTALIAQYHVIPCNDAPVLSSKARGQCVYVALPDFISFMRYRSHAA